MDAYLSVMIMQSTSPARRWSLLLGFGALLSLSACNNQYGPPPPGGKPENWGQQHYLDNKAYQQLNLDRIN